jgi:hypothetical protein
LLERVSRALNMPAFPVDVTVDEMTNEVIVRAEQLCQSEIQNDRKTLVIHLQRKVKKLKEKLVDKVEVGRVSMRALLFLGQTRWKTIMIVIGCIPFTWSHCFVVLDPFARSVQQITCCRLAEIVVITYALLAVIHATCNSHQRRHAAKPSVRDWLKRISTGGSCELFSHAVGFTPRRGLDSARQRRRVGVRGVDLGSSCLVEILLV